MKIAVCLFGQPRFFSIGLRSLKNALKAFDVDYFIHSWYDKNNVEFSNINASGISTSLKIEQDADEKIVQLIEPKRFVFEKPRIFTSQYDLDSRSKALTGAKNLMSMFYSTKQVGKLLEDYVDTTGQHYDLVFFTRTDVYIDEKNSLYVDTHRSFLAPNAVIAHYCQGEEWNNTHLNDAFVGSNNINFMLHYSRIFDYFEDYWASGHDLCSHRMKYFHMKGLKDITFHHVLKNKWWLCRSEGLLDSYGGITAYSKLINSEV